MKIIDAHAHLIPNELGVSIIKRYMVEANLAKVVLVPGGMINPWAMANFLRGTESLQLQEAPNEFLLDFCRGNEQFLPFFQVNPAMHDRSDVEAALERGAVGLKLNPLVDKVRFEDPELENIFELAHERELPVYTHILLNKSASIESLETLVKRYRRIAFIIGHMGYGTSDPMAISLAAKYDNVYLETSVGAYLSIEAAVEKAGAGKLIFGSEAPAHHPKAEWEKIELLKISDDKKELIASRNILRLLNME
jgi:hypothetical protein